MSVDLGHFAAYYKTVTDCSNHMLPAKALGLYFTKPAELIFSPILAHWYRACTTGMDAIQLG